MTRFLVAEVLRRHHAGSPSEEIEQFADDICSVHAVAKHLEEMVNLASRASDNAKLLMEAAGYIQKARKKLAALGWVGQAALTAKAEEIENRQPLGKHSARVPKTEALSVVDTELETFVKYLKGAADQSADGNYEPDFASDWGIKKRNGRRPDETAIRTAKAVIKAYETLSGEPVGRRINCSSGAPYGPLHGLTGDIFKALRIDASVDNSIRRALPMVKTAR